MNSPNMQEKVKAVMIRVLEDAAFLFSGEDCMQPATQWNAVGASITFSGERKGEFRLWADPSLGAVLASNMLGIDPASAADVAKKGVDALNETVNIMAGNLLTELFGTSAEIELGLPKPADPAMKEQDILRGDAVWLNAEENRLLGIVDVEERGGAAR